MSNETQELSNSITNKEDLKSYLTTIKDKLASGEAAPVQAMSAMNHALNLPQIYDLLDKSNKELAQEVWLKIKTSGVKIKNPPILFAEEEQA